MAKAVTPIRVLVEFHALRRHGTNADPSGESLIARLMRKATIDNTRPNKTYVLTQAVIGMAEAKNFHRFLHWRGPGANVIPGLRAARSARLFLVTDKSWTLIVHLLTVVGSG